ncbi:hypothetical protein [Herbidospora mongoliensis]|uniref:hypothetical protein n=1 Tax=Herbidospora mongoliensis TaxID=688067 RepID=UPI0012FB7E16|nr:hypothetical protein [Herbidospora mongoliensis]
MQITRDGLIAGMAAIEGEFRDLLKTGKQAVGLLPGDYAAGQFLNPDSMNQRGLYGTSAALLALSRANPDDDRNEHITGILRYLGHREKAERRLVRGPGEKAALQARLVAEVRTAFKCADLLYALSAAPLADGRDRLSRKLVERIEIARNPSGGWPGDLARQNVDQVATAAVVRARNAAGLHTDPKDVALIREVATDPDSDLPVRVLSLLVLLELPGTVPGADDLLTEFLTQLDPSVRAESFHEFPLVNHHEEVGVPWQLYLLCCAARHNPALLTSDHRLQSLLRDILEALKTKEGYVYSYRQPRKRSTRTYGILMDTLWQVQSALAGVPLPQPPALRRGPRLRNWVQALSWTGLTAAAGLAGLSLWGWAQGEEGPLGSVGGNVAATALLAFLGFLVRRVWGR